MIVAFSGKRGSGKSEATLALVQGLGFVPFALANPLKLFVFKILIAFDVSSERARRYLYGSSEAREEVIPEIGRSAREMLQKLGTDWGRECVHPDVWVRMLLAQSRVSFASGIGFALAGDIIVTDLRFPNELRAFRSAGALVIRLRRAGRASSAHDGHASETALDDAPDDAFSAVIDNEGTIQELHERVLAFVRSRHPKLAAASP